MIGLSRIRRRSWVFIAGAGLLSAALGLLALDQLFPPPIERGQIVSFVAEDREGRALRAFPVEDGRWRLATDLDRLDPDFVEALLIIEDQRFYEHWGVDPLAVIRAAGQAIQRGRIVSGASTITMQTARLLEPRPRNLGSKIIEAFRAVQLEARLSKDEILALYLTHTPYGGNLQGVRAASWAWFGREPDELTPDQIALLIALPQSPEVRRPDLRPAFAQASRAAILSRLVEAGWMTADRAVDAANEALPRSRNAFPAEAWHAAEAVRRQAGDAPFARSTLDRALQSEAERIVRQLAETGGEGVQASALIIEIGPRAVRAAVGSAGRDRAGGWLDLTAAPRSPGSTLKPLVYGLAFDDGLAAPNTLIEDLPARFANYRPENFDRSFRGEVTIADALQHSLNVPAVRVLDEVGAARFASVLDRAGARPQIPGALEGASGLAVALGGLGLSAQDLGVVYAAFGDEGRARPLTWLEASAPSPPGGTHRLLSAQSAGDILDVLYGSPAPPGRMPSHLSQSAPDIAYKTGTSYGFRDAWAAGVSGGYAVIVWTGRPDGAPRAGVTGRSAALPALFDLVDAVARTDPYFQPRRPSREAIDTPSALARFTREGEPPVILFPPDEAELWAERTGRGFVLSARGEGELSWYADGRPVPRDAGGSSIFTPRGPGFYQLAVVDRAGRTTRTTVQIRMPDTAS